AAAPRASDGYKPLRRSGRPRGGLKSQPPFRTNWECAMKHSPMHGSRNGVAERRSLARKARPAALTAALTDGKRRVSAKIPDTGYLSQTLGLSPVTPLHLKGFIMVSTGT